MGFVEERIERRKMTVMRFIWKLLKLRIKYGNVPVKTWIQYQGFCDLFEPELRMPTEIGKIIAIY